MHLVIHLFIYSLSQINAENNYHKFKLFLFSERDITHLFPIQAKTYDLVYDGNDVIARASKLNSYKILLSLNAFCAH